MTEKIISLSTYYYNKTEVDNLLKSKIIDASSTNPIDLNTYTIGGFYYCNSDASKAAYITANGNPLPIAGKSFFLLVEDWGTSNYTKQTLTHYNTNRTFIRIRTNSGGWGNWEELSKTSHVHGNITSDGKIGSDENKPIITTTNGTLTTGSFGTTANTFCQGNDSRLSNARTPTSHKHGDITNDGKIGSAEGKPIITTTNGTLSAGAFESTASNIQMNGTANVGSLNTFARADHIHPSDTSKSDINHTHTNLEETSSIPSDSDLNNELYTIAGYYKVKSGESKTLSNRPYPDETYNMAARIEVKAYKNGAYYEYIQFYYTYNDNINIYYRRGHKVDTTTSSYTPLTWGNWKKIANFEALSTVATSGSYEDLNDLPELKTVATSGLYEDLNGLPSIPTANTTNANIKMDGIQNAGSLDTYAKADHIHPINASIKTDDNLNNYIFPGFYYCTGSKIGTTVLNYPECDPTTLKNSNANGFTLLVEKLNDTSVKQTLTVYNSTNTNFRTFIRIKLANSTGNWNDWKEIEFKGHTHSVNNITDLAQVAKTNNYNDLNNKYEHPNTHPASMITGLSTVATTNNYNDLDNKYEHPSTHPASMITGLSTVATTNNYNDLNNKYQHPNTHPASMITGLGTVATTNNYNDLNNTPTWEQLNIDEVFETNNEYYNVNLNSTYCFINRQLKMINIRFAGQYNKVTAHYLYTWNGQDNTNYTRIVPEFRLNYAVYGSAHVVGGNNNGSDGTIWMDKDGFLGGRFSKTVENTNTAEFINIYGSLTWIYVNLNNK